MRTIAAIPCHNEALTIGSVVLKLKLARKYMDEVLLVDDGSTDDTVEVATAAGAGVVSHGVNNGYGAAIRTCFNYARETSVEYFLLIKLNEIYKLCKY